VVVALALAAGLLAALLHGPGSRASSGGHVPRPASPAEAPVAPPALGTPSQAGAGTRLLVLDVANPTSATLVGQSPPLALALGGLVLDASFAHLLGSANGIQMLDLSDPTHPAAAGRWWPNFSPRSLGISGGRIFAADYAVGPYEPYVDRVAMRDALASAAGPLAAHLTAPAAASRKGIRMALQGDYVYLAAEVGGLRILDAHDPGQPVFMGDYLGPDNVLGVAVEGRYAYLATHTKGLRVVDVADPAHPVEIGSYRTPGIITDVVIAGRYAYLADYLSGIQIVDVTDPTQPRGVASLQPPYFVSSIAVANGYLYVADGACGLRIFDVRQPLHAVEVDHYPLLGIASGVAVAGRYAYLSVTGLDAGRPCAPPVPPAVRSGGVTGAL
jgi:hypothetical protein